MLEDLHELTACEFEARARHLERLGAIHYAQGEDVRREYRDVAIGGGEVRRVSEWHAARGQGRREKWKRIAECKDSNSVMRIECAHCGGGSHEVPVGCGHRECRKCRGVQAARVQRDVAAARASLRREAKRRSCDRKIRERLLTLTVPHVGGGDVIPARDQKPIETIPHPTRRRIALLYAAWDRFADWLRRFACDLVPDSCEDLVHFFRVTEWTEGEGDRFGHPHFHVYLHGPYLPRDEIVKAWRRALEGASGEALDKDPIVDIRAAGERGQVQDENGKWRALEKELIKYLVKDFSTLARGQFVSAPILAAVHLELVSRRRRQTSAGFAAWIEDGKIASRERWCGECLGMHKLDYRHFRKSRPLVPCAQAPPDFDKGEAPIECDLAGRRIAVRIGPPARFVQPAPQLTLQV